MHPRYIPLIPMNVPPPSDKEHDDLMYRPGKLSRNYLVGKIASTSKLPLGETVLS